MKLVAGLEVALSASNRGLRREEARLRRLLRVLRRASAGLRRRGQRLRRSVSFLL